MTKKIRVGNTFIGGDATITVQSMLNIPFSRFDEMKTQAIRLEKAGCDIIRVAIPDRESALLLPKLKKELTVPVVADIHFDKELAIESIRNGADKIRINPGNIGKDGIKEVVKAATEYRVPIRIGINGGSLEKSVLKKYGHPCARALAESAALNVALVSELGFKDIVVSMKSSDVATAVSAYRIFAEEFNTEGFPLHVGITETGTAYTGTLKSAVGIGALLLDGIGDTIRVSLTADPVEEVSTGIALLKALHIRKEGIEVVSCPTCGRTTVNSAELAERIEKEFASVKKNVKIAVMGCVVNGIGESAEADFGVTGVNGRYVIFKNGTILQKDIAEEEIFPIIKEMIEKI